MDTRLITTAFELPNCTTLRTLGVVRGITVRSRSAIGNLGAGFQALFGGNITIYTELCEQARREAFELMVRHADEMGANAIIGMRYDANEISGGITEVLAYGTAVVVRQDATPPMVH
ncbi:MAG: YbjQ family protein [Planctomycetota bacterium]